MKKSILFFSILVSGLSLAAWAQTQDSSSTQPQQTFTVCSAPSEDERLLHSAEMAADMAQHRATLQADNKRTQAYYRKFAEAEAHKWGGRQSWEIEQQQKAAERTPDIVTVDPRGGVTRTYYNNGR